MKLIFKRKSVTRKKSNANKHKKRRVVRNMAKRKHSAKRKSTRKSIGSRLSSGNLFSGKVLGFQVPVVGKVIKNKTFQKIAVASGTVSLVGAVISMINNPQINALWQKPLVKDGVALMTGDVIGAIGRKVIENPQIIGSVTGRVSNGTQQSISQAGFA